MIIHFVIHCPFCIFIQFLFIELLSYFFCFFIHSYFYLLSRVLFFQSNFHSLDFDVLRFLYNLFVLGARKCAQTAPIQFTLIINIKKGTTVSDYIATVRDSRKSIVVGVRVGPSVLIDYMSIHGDIKTVQFDLEIGRRLAVQLVLSVGNKQIFLSIDCDRQMTKELPDDFPNDVDSVGIISVGKTNIPQVDKPI